MAKQRRYENGWTVDFPEELAWRAERQRLRVIALQRNQKVGYVVYDALKEYCDREEKKKR